MSGPPRAPARPGPPAEAPLSGGWFKVPNALVDAGHLAGLSRTELVALLTYLRYDLATPETVAKVAGISVRNAKRATARLVALGLLVTAKAGGGRGRLTRRVVVIKPR